MLKNLFQFLFITGLLMNLAACSPKTKTLKWREEVKLASGQVIMAERQKDYRSVYNGNNKGWHFEYEHLKAVLPPNRSVSWEGKVGGLALDVAKDGEIYLVTTIDTSQGRYEYSVPDDVNHVAFKYNASGQWERIPVTSIPQEIHPNLFVKADALFIDQGYQSNDVIVLALKSKLDSDPLMDQEYKGWLK
jgi:hypothetical protein